ncbi:hypothetical protein ACF3N7_02130 [Cruoricaptor ignavus]
MEIHNYISAIGIESASPHGAALSSSHRQGENKKLVLNIFHFFNFFIFNMAVTIISKLDDKIKRNEVTLICLSKKDIIDTISKHNVNTNNT